MKSSQHKTTVARQDVKDNKFNINAIILECFDWTKYDLPRIICKEIFIDCLLTEIYITVLDCGVLSILEKKVYNDILLFDDCYSIIVLCVRFADSCLICHRVWLCFANLFFLLRHLVRARMFDSFFNCYVILNFLNFGWVYKQRYINYDLIILVILVFL